MARLKAAQRRALPASAFAGPGRSFPVNDPGHAKAALGLINHAPASARPKIRARAEAMLHHNDGHHANAHPGEDGWHDGKTHKRHGVKSGKSGKFT